MKRSNLDLMCATYAMLKGNKKLEFIYRLGANAKATDRYIIQGGYVDNGYGVYWTKTDDSTGDAFAIGPEGMGIRYSITSFYVGCRPTLKFSDIPQKYMHGVSIKTDSEGVHRFYMGHDWTAAASVLMQQELEKLYQKRALALSTKAFTSCARISINTEYSSALVYKDEEVYEFEGELYVRAVAKFCNAAARLSNGVLYNKGDIVWCKVVPQSWLYDEHRDICMMENIPFAGAPFDCERNYETANFGQTYMKKYLDGYYSVELMQCTTGSVVDEKIDENLLSKLSEFHTQRVAINELKVGDCVLLDEDIFCVWQIWGDRVVFSNFAGEFMNFSISSKRQFTKVTIR